MIYRNRVISSLFLITDIVTLFEYYYKADKLNFKLIRISSDTETDKFENLPNGSYIVIY